VPTLWNEIEQLERKLKHRSGDLLHVERELKDLRRKYTKLKSSYEAVTSYYERAMQLLKKDKERRWRTRRLY
jgi:chromosome segregation ATPase